MAFSSMVESNWKSIAHNTFGASATTSGINDTPARLRGYGPDLQPFLAPQSVDLILVDLTALVVALRRPGTPEPQGRGVLRRRRVARPSFRRPDRLGSATVGDGCGCSGQPNGLARQPSRQAQSVLEHVDGGALGSWTQNLPPTSRFNRAFCSRNSFSSLAVSMSIPP